MKLSLLVPCFNEEENVKPFFEACSKAFSGKIDCYEIIFVNDGSKDNTWSELKKLKESEKNAKINIINFSRNFGKESAILAGMKMASGDYVSIIDADLQQHPSIVVEMVNILDKDSNYDVVAAYQEERIEGKTTSVLKKYFYKVINKISDVDFHSDASDFRTFRKKVAEAILSLPEYHRFSKGIFSWVGFNTYYIPYIAEERHAGVTSWSTRKLFKYAFDGIISFSSFPLKISVWLGTVFAALSPVYLLARLILFFGFDKPIPQSFVPIVLLLLIGGIQLIVLGIIGEYIARIHTQVKNRPSYIIKESESYENEENDS